MGAAQMRNELFELINRADERALHIIYDAVIHANKSEARIVSDVVVGYELSGKPITRTEMVKRIEEAEARIFNGEYITQEDQERESEGW